MELKSPAMFIGVHGEGIISFGSGQPDLPPPKEVCSVVPQQKAFKYGLIQGNENLRHELSKQEQFKGTDQDNFVITNGASEAIDLVLRSFGSGKVLLHAPYYYSYPPVVKAAGMKPVYTQTLINSPSNPTGRIQDVNTLKEIEKLTTDLGIVLISDEVYKDLIYERQNYMLSGPHVVTVNSFSKTFAMCGLRVGYLYSNDKSIVNEVIELKTHTSMNTNILAQDMAYEALKAPHTYVEKQHKIWQERRDLIYEGLCDLGLELWKPEGAFYVFPKVKNPKKMVWDLYKKHKVITYLGEWFGDSERIRLSYALDKAEIEEGLKRIGKYLGQ
jgi:aspartate aminotransferase